MRVTVTTALIGILLGAGGAGDSARAGSLAISGADASAAESDARSAWALRVEAARQRYQTFAARAASEFRARQPARIDAALPVARFAGALDDPTLRYNDLVVTADGVFAFRGSEAVRHSEADFERLPEARVRALSLRIYGQTN
ncbi:MAG: hypothetical protein U1E20_14620 [Methylocystis sp.]|uniref:hypothetical protein n=1 Tax=Methylocystis sp. TaxID=1911079 RepID=UPI003935FD1D